MSDLPSLESYRSITANCTVTLPLTQQEAAACLKAHDYGLAMLSPDELALCDHVISEIKNAVWS